MVRRDDTSGGGALDDPPVQDDSDVSRRAQIWRWIRIELCVFQQLAVEDRGK
jgi:hypothetical protein